jgi:hypothetical protein
LTYCEKRTHDPLIASLKCEGCGSSSETRFSCEVSRLEGG